MITAVTRDGFDAIDPAFRCIEHDHPRAYAVVELPGVPHRYGLSWRSDGIAPAEVTDDRNGTTWIGVDQKIVGLSAGGCLAFSIGLPSLLLQMKLFPEFLVVLCETEVLAINRDFSLRQVVPVADLPESATAVDGRVEIRAGEATYTIT